MKNLLNKLTAKEKNDLFGSFYYCKMEELKEFCIQINIPKNGKKGVIIDRIKHYLLHGSVLECKEIPQNSIAKPGHDYPLKLESLILKGAYKNDLKTRQFFKTIIGEHFHFTAFGIDWILNLWEKGTPPTYAEFAKMWQEEYARRSEEKPQLKKEWAYLNFIKNFQEKNPHATSKKEQAVEWERIRKEHFMRAKKTLEKIIPK